MKRAPAILLLLVLCASARADFYIVQNIFDDETPDAPPEKPPVSAEKPVKKPVAEEKSGENTKPAAKGKKKRGKGGKKKKKGTPAAQSAKSGYSTTDVARASYEWAPETEVFTLQSSAPGIRPSAEGPVAVKTAQTNAKPEAIETKPQSQGFRLPQIPLAQVLIVAGFVLLFLIYRFRVGKQIKRKKY